MRNVITSLLLVTASMTSIFAQNPSPTESSKSVSPHQPLKLDLLPPLQRMATGMNKLKTTGDPDVDYARLAALQMQGTRELLVEIIGVQSDSALTQAAKTMLATAETDLTSLNTTLKTLQPNQRNAAFARRQKRVLAGITEKVKQSRSTYKLTPNPAANIAILLRDQQQDAVNLATNYLLFGKDVTLRNFAQQSVEKAQLALDVLNNLPNRSN